MKFELPILDFEHNALEPYISARTIEFHYGKHLRVYVNNLNSFIDGTKFANVDLRTIIKESSGILFNNAAQVWNHIFYFEQLSGTPKKMPENGLLDAINQAFGSYDDFKLEFDKKTISLFGSGWSWLSIDNAGNLAISQTSNAENPITANHQPLLTCDVWEHAYYIDYQNRRVDYVTGFWNVMDWNVIEKRFMMLKGK